MIKTAFCYTCKRELPLAQFYKRDNGTPECHRCKQCAALKAAAHIEELSYADTRNHSWGKILKHNEAVKAWCNSWRCPRCGAKKGVLQQLIATNGVPQVSFFCGSCSLKTGPIGHKKLIDDGVIIDLVPTVVPEFVNKDFSPVCAVDGCYRTDVELHHWFPRHLWRGADGDNYPQSYLCREHHRHWHSRVTPEMHKNKSR